MPRADETPNPLRLPTIASTTDVVLDATLRQRWRRSDLPAHALGQLEPLVLLLARVQNTEAQPFTQLRLHAPQLVVFAADHGLADEGVSAFPQNATLERVRQLLRGNTATNAMAGLQGFKLTVVDAGMATPIALEADEIPRVPLQLRKIGYATRNVVLSTAMSIPQAVAALHAGMDVVQHLPGNVLALGDVGVGSTACASLLFSRLCGVPLDKVLDAGEDAADTRQPHRLHKLLTAAYRHRKANAPLEVLAAMGGFEIAMMAGAMLQAAAERRVVLVDGYVSGAAALVARALSPAVGDYLVFCHRSPHPGHRLMLAHLNAQPLLDLGLHTGQGLGTLLAWPLLLAAQRLVAH